MKRLLGAACALALLSAGPATAQTTKGSTLQNAPNTTFGCEVAPGTALFAPELILEPHGLPSCSWWSEGSAAVVGDPRSSRVPGTGTVTKVRVRSGSNPAPIRIAILRSTDGMCCEAVRVTEPVQPAANRVSEFEVNLPVELVKGIVPSTGETIAWTDMVGVSAAAGAGTLPIHDQGPGTHTPEAAISNPNVLLSNMTAPELLPTDGIRISGRGGPGYEVLLQFDHVRCPTNAYGQPLARAAQVGCRSGATPAGGGDSAPPPPPPPPPPAPAPPAQLAELGGSGTLRVRRGRLALPVRCAATVACRGRLRVLTRARRPRVLASAAVDVAAGQTRTIRPALTRAGRRALRRGKRRVRAVAVLDLGAGGAIRRDVTLRR